MRYTQLHENRLHGTPDFPVKHYPACEGRPRYRMELHWHREMELVHITSGRFTIYLNNRMQELNAGDTAVIGCGMLHRGEPENCVYECLLFDPQMLCRQKSDRIAPLLGALVTGEAEVVRYLPAADPLSGTVKDLMRECAAEEPYYELAVYARLFDFFRELYRTGRIGLPEQQGTANQIAVITDLLDWLEEHFAEPVTLSLLADRAGLNEKYLCRLFRSYTGTTLVDYLNRRRIDHACRALAVSRLSVTEAAFDSGFNDLSYFSRIFRRYRGMTPREYARTVRTEKKPR